MIYTASVKNKAIAIIGDSELVRGNTEVDYLQVAFDAEWADMTIEAIFINGALKRRMDVVDDQCEIPWEVYEELGSVYVTFIGYDSSKENLRLVTRKMSKPFTVVERGGVDGEDGREPSCDTYQNLMKMLKKVAIPDDGEDGQVLMTTPEGAAWGDLPEALPEGGEADQVLTRTENGSEWQPLPEALPEVSDADNGKVLRVLDGAWAAVSLTNAEGVGF